MKLTKIELSQKNQQLGADNLALREINSVLTTERDTAIAAINTVSTALETATAEIITLRAKLAESRKWSALWRAKADATYKPEPSARRVAMDAAKAAAATTGQTTKVGA